MSPAVAALAVLALRASALQVDSDTDTGKICPGEMVEWEAPHALIGMCNVFCVPEGECMRRAQMGELKHLGVTEPGNCRRKGYTEDTPFGDTTRRLATSLRYTMGACQGMSLAKKFKKPATTVPESGAPGKGVCPFEMVPFEGTSVAYPGLCSRFCVPEGACQERALKGGFAYLGLTAPGDCVSKGYTFESAMTNMTRNTVSYLNSLVGVCRGMTLTKFQKPPREGLKPGAPLCPQDTVAFTGIPPHNPHMCSIFCIPDGACVGKVQTGAMNQYGIIDGTCKKMGYTEFLPRASNTSKYLLSAPCRGIERFNFLKPGHAGQ